MSGEAFKIALFAGPAYGLGTWGGSHMFGLASPRVFRASSLALIAPAVVVSLPIYR